MWQRYINWKTMKRRGLYRAWLWIIKRYVLSQWRCKRDTTPSSNYYQLIIVTESRGAGIVINTTNKAARVHLNPEFNTYSLSHWQRPAFRHDFCVNNSGATTLSSFAKSGASRAAEVHGHPCVGASRADRRGANVKIKPPDAHGTSFTYRSLLAECHQRYLKKPKQTFLQTKCAKILQPCSGTSLVSGGMHMWSSKICCHAHFRLSLLHPRVHHCGIIFLTFVVIIKAKKVLANSLVHNL